MKYKKKPTVIKQVIIEDYAAEGKSLTRIEGKVYFVERTVPGDLVDIQVFKNKKDWAEAFPLYFHKYATDRVTPICKHFGTCGGCVWQMLPYSKQLLYKQKQVADHFNRIAKVPIPPILPILPAEQPYAYRNKMIYSFSNRCFIDEDSFRQLKKENKTIQNEGMFIGFHPKGFFDKVVPIEQCHLQPHLGNEIRNTLFNYVCKQGYPCYDSITKKGWLRNLMIRNTIQQEWMLNLVVAYQQEEWIQATLSYMVQQYPHITSFFYTINEKYNDAIDNLNPICFYGHPYITDRLENFLYKVSPLSFFQTNSLQAAQLYKIVRDFANLTRKEIVYDLYCGIGSIGLFISPHAKKVIGIEIVPAAIKDAEENIQLNHIVNMTCICGDVAKICNNHFFDTHGRPDVVIIDPPRAGAHPTLIETLLHMLPPVIIYVSCNTATQARDVNNLSLHYTVEQIQPVDMFPQTHHIENIIQLKKK